MIIFFFANRTGARAHSRDKTWAIAQLWSPPAILFCLFFLFFSVKCHIQQLEKAVSILNIKKNEKCNKYPVLFNHPPRKKNEIKKILPFDCSIYSQINFRNKTKKNLPPFYELMNYDTSNDMIFPLSCWQKIMKKYKQKP